MHMTWSCHLHTHHGNLEKQNTTGIPLGEGLFLFIVKLKENKILRVIIASSLVWRPQQTHVTFYSYNFATISWMNVVLRRSLLCRPCAEEGQAIGARLKPVHRLWVHYWISLIKLQVINVKAVDCGSFWTILGTEQGFQDTGYLGKKINGIWDQMKRKLMA